MDLTNLQTSLNEAINRHHVAGASVAVFCGGELKTAVAGVTNVTTGVAITTDTVMHIGSIAKLFTATLIMQLVEEGKIELDDPVSKHLPKLQLKDLDALERITIKMLLNHSSGIDGEMLPNQGHDEETIEKGIVRFASLGQLFPPGNGCSYCNAAVVIAGYLAQCVTGISWYELIKQRIFVPLEMQHAVTLPEEALLHSAAIGHYFNPKTNDITRTAVSLLPLSFSPGGTTLMMSAKDLVNFALAHIGGGVGANGERILQEQSTTSMRELTSRFASITEAIGIGYGWMIFDNGLVGHGGGAPGVVSWLYVHPEKKVVAAVLTNTDNGLVLINDFLTPWLEEVAGVLPYGSPIDQSLPVDEVKIDSAMYIGVYEDVSMRYRITELPDGLGFSTQNKFVNYDSKTTEEKPVIRLTPHGNNVFISNPTDEQDAKNISESDASVSLTFLNPDTEGRMQHIGTGVRLYRRVA